MIAVAVAIGLGFAGLFAIEVASEAYGCGSVDPTDPNNYSAVELRNDTAQAVIVGDCKGTYCNIDQPTRIEPGGQAQVWGGCGDSGSDMTSYRVTDPSGHERGFLAIDTPKKRDGLIYDASRLSPTRRTATRPR